VEALKQNQTLPPDRVRRPGSGNSNSSAAHTETFGMEISVRLGLRLTAKSAGLLSGVYRRVVASFSVTQDGNGPGWEVAVPSVWRAMPPNRKP
jgi:hypothetical protein